MCSLQDLPTENIWQLWIDCQALHQAHHSRRDNGAVCQRSVEVLAEHLEMNSTQDHPWRVGKAVAHGLSASKSSQQFHKLVCEDSSQGENEVTAHDKLVTEEAMKEHGQYVLNFLGNSTYYIHFTYDFRDI
jgi:hypothetical protein